MLSIRRTALASMIIVSIVSLLIIAHSLPAMAISIPSVDITSSNPAYASGPVTVNYTLNGISNGNAWLIVKNQAGSIMRTVSGGAVSGSGPYSISWDGKDGSGNLVPVGNYTLLVAVNRSALTYVGEWGGKAIAYPQAWGVGINSTGYAYVTDSINSNITIYDPAGDSRQAVRVSGIGPGAALAAGNSRDELYWLCICRGLF